MHSAGRSEQDLGTHPSLSLQKASSCPPACRAQSVALQSGGLAGWCSPTNGQRLRVWGPRGEDGGTARAAGERSCSGESGVPEPLWMGYHSHQKELTPTVSS